MVREVTNRVGVLVTTLVVTRLPLLLSYTNIVEFGDRDREKETVRGLGG